MKRVALLLFLITITNPYEDISCYECITVYDLEEKPEYQIKTYGPIKNDNETEFSDAEINHFARKVQKLIDYSQYVYQ